MTAPYEVGIYLEFDLQTDLITVKRAAEIAGVSRATVEKWMRRGYLDRHGNRAKVPDHGVPGAPRVIGIEVLRAEAATRARAGRQPFPHRRRSDM